MPLGIFQKAGNDQQDHHSDGEGGDDGDALEVRHGAVGEGQSDGQQDQHDGPEHFYKGVGVLISGELPVGVSRGNQSDGVKAGGVKSDHGGN